MPRPSALAIAFCVSLAGLTACSSDSEEEPVLPTPGATPTAEFTGSASCRECHERFYQLWSPSHHGRAMQVFSAELAREHLTPFGQEVAVGDLRYRFVLDQERGWIEELGSGELERHQVLHALGGKNVYYLLTPLERGRLQVLPIAFDVNRREWFDTAASAVRHFVDEPDEAVEWTHPSLTFNTSCHGCHVSQLVPNYDLASDSYRTTWLEPGINCETCHGPAGEHVRSFRAAAGGTPPELNLISAKRMSPDQRNALCASCHAKLTPITPSFEPGGRFFDHYDLVAFENRDFYPDGRDLGENYTMTQWLVSPCAASGQLDCLHCHTSSGRDRHVGERADEACLPCHAERVANATEHTHHPPESAGSRCISCHMPKTWFARMQRHDHSMRAPTPAASLAFGSPNACNICHEDRDAAWADQWVRRWRQRDYQAPVLRRGRLIEAARNRDFSRLDEMLAEIEGGERTAVYAASLIRLLRHGTSEATLSTLVRALDDGSPLVRGAAAEALGDHLTPTILEPLLAATQDDYRLVRVRAAAALAGVPDRMLNEDARASLSSALAELESSMKSRPDDPAAHYNLGNLALQRGNASAAVASYETATKLRPEFLAPLVNASLAYSRLGRNDRAEKALRDALRVDPDNAAAHLNLGLLLAEEGRRVGAIAALRAALAADPALPVAAYNLAVLLSAERLDEALVWCARAHELAPTEPKYAYTLAFYQRQSGATAAAVKTLEQLIADHPGYTDARRLLAATAPGVKAPAVR